MFHGAVDGRKLQEMVVEPHAVAIFTTLGVAVLMALTGIHKSALEWRARRRICPSCGRDLRTRCVCR
jgi:hypothetical protein